MKKESRWRWLLRAGYTTAFCCWMTGNSGLHADVIDDYSAFETQLQEATLDACAELKNAPGWAALVQTATQLTADLQGPESQRAGQEILAQLKATPGNDPAAQAPICGNLAGQLPHLCAVEMLWRQQKNDVAGAQEWRALINLPKHASAIEGALALQSQLTQQSQTAPVTTLLAREYLSWQTTRIREKLSNLQRLLGSGHYNAALLEIRFAEIARLRAFPVTLTTRAQIPAVDATTAELTQTAQRLAKQAGAGWDAAVTTQFQTWRHEIEGRLPSLLSTQEISRHERLLLKLVRLISKEYGNGVRDGQIVVPLEYREAVMFVEQAQQLVDELSPVWQTTRATALQKEGGPLISALEQTEKAINAKASLATVEAGSGLAQQLLEGSFGLTLQRSGDSAAVLEETVLDVRTSLKNSLAAAQNGSWSIAESHRLDAYTTFDAEIEKRVLPRDYALGIKTERSFLDGQTGSLGIKAALDVRQQGAELEAIYQRTLDHVMECQSLLKVGLSPATVIYTTVSIVAREGLEAVVILAALLAGLRGAENKPTRRWIVRGAWLALLATAATFWLSRTLISALAHYGEKLEAIVSILAVIILLIVTNWVFHKYYWSEWNAKLRHLTRASEKGQTARWQWLALVSVGFVTIYREGFETSLFMQSLLLEGSQRAVGIGVLLSLLLIGAIGTGIFVIGAKLPLRKMLIVTGLFVVSILVTFLGSSVRLFQTVGWLPIHPISDLEIPIWMGQWLGLYPSWEGLLVPFLGLGYVAGAWLYMKWVAWREHGKAAATAKSSSSRPRTATASV